MFPATFAAGRRFGYRGLSWSQVCCKSSVGNGLLSFFQTVRTGTKPVMRADGGWGGNGGRYSVHSMGVSAGGLKVVPTRTQARL